MSVIIVFLFLSQQVFFFNFHKSPAELFDEVVKFEVSKIEFYTSQVLPIKHTIKQYMMCFILSYA